MFAICKLIASIRDRLVQGFPISSAAASISAEVEEEIKKISEELKEVEKTRRWMEDLIAEGEVRKQPLPDGLLELKALADDLRDVYNYQVTATKGLEENSNVEVCSSRSQSPLQDSIFRKKIAEDLGIFNKRFKNHSDRLNFLRLHYLPDGPSFSAKTTGSHVTDPVFVGRVEELKEVLRLLASREGDSDGSHMAPVIALIGIDGVGKTALAQHAYNHPELQERQIFDLKGWVCASDFFDSKLFMKAIIEVFSGSSCSLTQLSAMQDEVQRLIEGKKVLLVMDDLRIADSDSDSATWEILVNPIKTLAERGSKILVTTSCIPENVLRARSVVPIRLDNLSADDGWTLLQEHAFPDSRPASPIPEDLEPIGRLIVEKAGCLPSLLKFFGLLLKSKELNENTWRNVYGSSIFDDFAEEKAIGCLHISYMHLSPKAKDCFQHCRIYSKDEMPRRGLKHSWIAYDLVKDENEANIYLEELESKSFLQVHGNCIRMHDYLYDLAQYMSRARHLIFSCRKTIPEQEDLDRFRDAKHATVKMEPYDGALLKVDNMPYAQMRTFMMNGSLFSPSELYISIGERLQVLYINVPDSNGFGTEIKGLRYLRVLELRSNKLRSVPDWVFYLYNLRHLDLSSTDISCLPSKISKLKNLRSLNLEGSGIKVLPESISKLINLQDLTLRGCWGLRKLPESIVNLSSLYSLNLQHTGISYMPKGFGNLTQLRFLTDFPVGSKNEGAGLAELQNMECLKDIIFIVNLSKSEGVEDAQDARDAQLANKKYLRKLVLCWGRYFSRKLRFREKFKSSYEYYSQENSVLPPETERSLENRNGQEGAAASNSSDRVLELMTPHVNLEELSISDYRGRLPSWMKIESFKKLVLLQLCDITDCISLSPAENLPSLAILDIHSLSSLESLVDAHIEQAATNQRLLFPKLEQLYVESCNVLGVLRLAEFASLKEVEARNCSRITCIEHPISVNTITISGCPEFEQEDRHQQPPWNIEDNR